MLQNMFTWKLLLLRMFPHYIITRNTPVIAIIEMNTNIDTYNGNECHMSTSIKYNNDK